MIYVIDVSERREKWKSKLLTEWDICLVATDLPKDFKLSADDFVFAHSTNFGADLTDSEYSEDPKIREHLDHIPNGIRNILRFREALRSTVRSGRVPPLVIYHGDTLNRDKIRRFVNKCSLKGFPREKVETTDPIGYIEVPELKSFVKRTINRLSSGKSFDKREMAVGRLCAINLLCDAWLLGHKLSGKDYNGITIRAPAKPIDWFRPFGKIASEQAAVEITQEIEPHVARKAVCKFLQQVAAECEVTKDRVATLKSVLYPAIKSNASK